MCSPRHSTSGTQWFWGETCKLSASKSLVYGSVGAVLVLLAVGGCPDRFLQPISEETAQVSSGVRPSEGTTVGILQGTAPSSAVGHYPRPGEVQPLPALGIQGAACWSDKVYPFGREMESNIYVLTLDNVTKLPGVCNHLGCPQSNSCARTLGMCCLVSFSPAVKWIRLT